LSEALVITSEALDLRSQYFVARSSATYSLAKVKLSIKYRCQKFLGFLSKCEEDFKVEPHVEPGGLEVRLVIEKLDFDGKLEAREAEGGVISVKVARGSGEGRVEAIYRIDLVNPQKEGNYRVLIKFYKASAKEVVEIPKATYELPIAVMEPPQIVDTRIEPSREVFEGDKFTVVVRFKSFIEDRIEYAITYNGEKHSNVLDVKPHRTYEIYSDFTASSGATDVLIELRSSKLEYIERRKAELLLMKPPRTEIVSAEIGGKAKIGRPTQLNLELRNRSKSTAVELVIRGGVYGHRVEERLRLDPGEETQIQLRTPILSIASLTATKAELEIVEYPGGFIIKRDIELQEPEKPKIRFTVDPDRIRMFSVSSGTAVLKCVNGEDFDIEFAVERIDADNVVAEINRKSVTVEKSGSGEVKMEIKPHSVGKGRITVALAAFVNGVKIAHEELSIGVEVVPSFEVSKIEVKNAPGNRVLKGQKLRLGVEFINYTDKPVEISLGGADAKVEWPFTLLLNPRGLGPTVSELEAVVEGGKPTILFSDGVHTVERTLSVEVVKPHAEISLDTKRIYLGVENTVRIRLENPLGDSIAVEIRDISYTDNLELVNPKSQISVTLDPGATKVIELKMRGRSRGKSTIALAVVAKYGSESNEFKRIFEAVIEAPLSVEIKKGDRTVNLPYLPPPYQLQKLYSGTEFSLILRNVSDTSINNISIAVKPPNHAGEYVNIRCDRAQIYHLNAGGEETVGCSMKVDAAYPYDSLELLYTVKVDGINVLEDSISYSIKRENFIVVEYAKGSFNERCPYPYVEQKGFIRAYIPISQNPSVCGSPMEYSKQLVNVAKLLYGKLEKTEASDELWNKVCKAFFTLITGRKGRAASEDVGRIVAEITERFGETIIVPALIWRYALSKLSGREANTKAGKSATPSLVAFTHNKWYSINNTFYSYLLKALVEGDTGSANKLREMIVNSSYRALHPLLLAYAIARGDLLEYDSEVASKLSQNTQDTRKYLLYLALAEPLWIRDENELKRFENVLKSLQPERGADFVELLSLTVIYLKILYKSLALLGEQHVVRS